MSQLGTKAKELLKSIESSWRIPSNMPLSYLAAAGGIMKQCARNWQLQCKDSWTISPAEHNEDELEKRKKASAWINLRMTLNSHPRKPHNLPSHECLGKQMYAKSPGFHQLASCGEHSKQKQPDPMWQQSRLCGSHCPIAYECLHWDTRNLAPPPVKSRVSHLIGTLVVSSRNEMSKPKMTNIGKYCHLLWKPRISWHNHTPAATCCSHGRDIKPFSPFLVDPFEGKRVADFVRLLSVWCTCK